MWRGVVWRSVAWRGTCCVSCVLYTVLWHVSYELCCAMWYRASCRVVTFGAVWWCVVWCGVVRWDVVRWDVVWWRVALRCVALRCVRVAWRGTECNLV